MSFYRRPYHEIYKEIPQADLNHKEVKGAKWRNRAERKLGTTKAGLQSHSPTYTPHNTPHSTDSKAVSHLRDGEDLCQSLLLKEQTGFTRKNKLYRGKKKAIGLHLKLVIKVNMTGKKKEINIRNALMWCMEKARQSSSILAQEIPNLVTTKCQKQLEGQSTE